MAKLSDQISVRIDPEWREILREIEEKHRISPPEFMRGLAEAGIQYYRRNGFFAFPVELRPSMEFVRAVAEAHDAKAAKARPGTPTPR